MESDKLTVRNWLYPAVRGYPGVWPLYKQRNLIERFFNKIKHFRRIATRYEKRASNDLAMIKLAAIRIWLRNKESMA